MGGYSHQIWPCMLATVASKLGTSTEFPNDFQVLFSEDLEALKLPIHDLSNPFLRL